MLCVFAEHLDVKTTTTEKERFDESFKRIFSLYVH